MSERLRMPRTPTGTNLAGIVKHCASVEVGVLRESIDGSTGLNPPYPSPPGGDQVDWRAYVARLTALALAFPG